MKKSIITAVVFALMASAAITGCVTPAQKVKNAKSDVNEANEDLAKAQEEYLKDVESYRKETADMVAINNKSIAELKDKIKDEKEEAKAQYQKQIGALEQKNNDLKARMDNYKVEGKDKWKMFKTEFSHDMSELGKAFKDLVVKNTN